MAGLKREYRSLALPARLRAILEYAEQLTLHPRGLSAADLAPLRVEGLSDRDIVDLNQVVSYFNYVNRIAAGLGVDLEPEYAGES